MAVQVEIWERYIQDNLFMNDTFLDTFKNKDGFVVNGKILHIPQAGAVPNVVINRSNLPAVPLKREDADTVYELGEYSSDPVLIPNADKYELSYDKMASVIGDHVGVLSNTIGNRALVDIAPSRSGRIIRIGTGQTTTVNAHTAGATGTRKPFVADDLRKVQTLFNKDNLPVSGEFYALMDADIYDQLVQSLSASVYRDYMRVMDEKTGVVAKLFGFNIMIRSKGCVYDNALMPAPKPYGSVGAATDNAAVLCWHSSAVFRAQGSISFFQKQNDPQYYGDIYSFLVRFLAGKERADQAGIAALVQQV